MSQSAVKFSVRQNAHRCASAKIGVWPTLVVTHLTLGHTSQLKHLWNFLEYSSQHLQKLEFATNEGAAGLLIAKLL